VEHQWEAVAGEAGLPLHIFRVGGIYGPGRSALEAAAKAASGRQARPSSRRRAQRRFTSRVHVADVCSVVQASMAQPVRSQCKVGIPFFWGGMLKGFSA
jgi:nucleoside-diphosphate-sugar epimerase